jgi:hypothetical protein
MNKYFVTFDYSSITDPEGNEFSDEREAADQFVAEISHARAFAGWDDLVGYRLLDRDVARRRWVVSFVVESADEETFCRDIQKWLFDENGMSGNYIIGREIPFMVTVRVEYHVTVIEYARSASEAEENAQREIKGDVTASPTMSSYADEKRSRIEAYAVSALTHPRLPTLDNATTAE